MKTVSLLLLPARFRSNGFFVRFFLRERCVRLLVYRKAWMGLHLYLLAVVVVAVAAVAAATIPSFSCGHRILNCVML